MITNEQDVISMIEQDKWMMRLLRTVQALELSDWWICAGFVRSKIWDNLHEFAEKTPLSDVDVIYFDPHQTDKAKERELENQLNRLFPGIPWSVKNQARMHIRNGVEPYTSSVDAISKFPETATALGISLDSSTQLVLAAPHGIWDAINFKVKPTPYFATCESRMEIYKRRVLKKQWELIWCRLEIQLELPYSNKSEDR